MFQHNFLPFTELATVTLHNARYYITPEGPKYPSVTSVLGRASDQTWLKEWKERVGEEEARKISFSAMGKGTTVHTACEWFLRNDPKLAFKLSKVMPTTLAAFAKIRPILQKYVAEVYGIELPLYSHDLKTAGRTDALVKLKSVKAILDFKTTRGAFMPKEESDIENYFLQTTAYALMAEERHGIEVPAIAILLTNGLDRPQFFVREKKNYVEKTKEIFYAQAKEEELRMVNADK